MRRQSQTTKTILDALKTKTVWTCSSLREELREKHGVKVSMGDISCRLYRLWKQNLISRSVRPISGKNGRHEYVYSYGDAKNQRVSVESYGKTYEIQIARYSAKNSLTNSSASVRSIIKQIFSAQEKPEPLFPQEISQIMKEKHGHQPNYITLCSALNKMVYRYGELSRSKAKFEQGYLYYLDSRTIEEWIQNPPHKGLLRDEKCILQLIKDKSVMTTRDIRREAIKGKSILPTAFATIIFKTRKLKELVPWVRTDQYASVTIIYDANANPEILEEKLKQVKFWLSDEAKRRRIYGYEFESFGAYIFHNIVHEENKEWYSTDIEVEKNKRGRFGEYDLIIAHTFGPIEFGLREEMVFEFKTTGRVEWSDLFGHNPKKGWGFISKLEMEKENGIFRGKFVKPILVLAHTIESGLPYEIRKRGVTIIYMSELLEYLNRKGIDPDRILKAIKAKYYKP